MTSDLTGLQARDAGHQLAVTAADTGMGLIAQGVSAVAAARGIPPAVTQMILSRLCDALLSELDLAAAPTLKGPGVEAHGIDVRR